jgi:hypothetical protein
MPDSTHKNGSTGNKDQKKNYVLDPGIQRILLAGAGLLIVVIVGTFFLPAGRILFFTQNFLALVVLVVIGIQAYIYSGQWRAMQDSLKAIGEQINIGRQQTDWMRIQAQAMTSQIEILNSQTSAMILSLEETRKIVDQNERTIKTTEKSVEIAEQTSIYSQRAYVTAKIGDIGERDDTLQFRLRIENSGNTPANDVMVVYSFGLREKSPHEKDRETGLIVYDMGFTETERLGLIAPNGSYHVISTPEILVVQAGPTYGLTEEFKRFEAGEFRFYCWGRIVYEDIFNEKRQTEFCFCQSIERPNGYPCQYGNHAM